MSLENINSFWSSLIVEELVRNGISFFCISPGSRSTPLTVAATQHPQTNCQLAHDERGSAYMALGYARATGKAAALICTSGTAAANFYPAIIEASMDDMPMIVLTADRPPELLDTSANQTIHQPKMYGDYTRWDFNIPTPSDEISPRFVLTTIDQAAHRSLSPVPGPIHLNCMFREPLAPTPKKFSIQKDDKFESWQKQSQPFTRYPSSHHQISQDELSALTDTINATHNGFVILGRLSIQHQQSQIIEQFLAALKWPVYADIASGFRLGKTRWPAVDDKLLYSEKFLKDWQLDTVLHLGGSFLSKNLQRWLERNPHQNYIHVHNNFRRVDPGHLVTQNISTDVERLCAELFKRIKATNSTPGIHLPNDKIKKHIEKFIQTDSINEPAVAQTVSREIPAHHSLFLGNSMPIRDMNTFAVIRGERVPIATNRGASGIDGNIATAVGVAHGLDFPVTIILGDVATLHDLNSLYLTKNSPPIIIVVINNDGGGIFSFLPISQHKAVFEKWFETPHGVSFEKAAKLFNLPYKQPKTLPEFINTYKKAVTGTSSILIEVKSDKKSNLDLHQQIKIAIQQFVDSL